MEGVCYEALADTTDAPGRLMTFSSIMQDCSQQMVQQ